MEKKNTWLAGLFNILVPGYGSWYVDKDRGRFIRTLILGIVAMAVTITIGLLIQRGFLVPQGLCPGVLLLLVLVPLFRSGRQTAIQHNSGLDNATRYNARQSGSDEAQLERNQDMRDKGLISEQEYDSRKDNINRKN